MVSVEKRGSGYAACEISLQADEHAYLQQMPVLLKKDYIQIIV